LESERSERTATRAQPARPRRDPLLFWTVGPGLLALLLLFVAPLLIVGAYSLARPAPDGGVAAGFTLQSYARVLDPLYLSVLSRSVLLAGVTTLLSLLFAFPTAWAIRGLDAKRRALLLALVILPSWMNLLVKNYAWIVLLRREGVINSALMGLGLVEEPLPLLFNDGAVLVGLVHTYLPFMVLPLYAALDRMDWSLVEAARDLAAGPWQTFRHVVVPETIGGISVGCTLVFVPALGAFVTPDLLGGPRSLMVGTLVESQVLQVRDWPFASAMAVALMLVVLVSLTLSRRALTRPGQEGLF
jgi:spermidine/putrescine transport system permease protein